MTRGMFDFLRNEPAYTGADKDWYVELIQSNCFWYDLIVNPPDEFNTKQQITDFLKGLQTIVETQLDKRFIYFLAARKKLRFCTMKKPRYALFSSDLIFYVETGRERTRQKLNMKIFDVATRKPIKPKVELSDRFITFHYTENHKVSMSIYDFLQIGGVETGINTEIHYVGYTKNPSERPINGTHRGLSDMLYRVSNEEHDFFIFYNLFKVLSIGKNPTALINFCVANSMIDEIKVDEEGRIIEKALIKYFGAETQEINKENEEAELKNSLERLAEKNKINTVAIHIELEKPNELYRFFSRSAKPADKHVFTCHIGSGGIEITKGSDITEKFSETPEKK